MATSLGKRGRSTPQSKEATYGSTKSYDKYFSKHGDSMQTVPKSQEEALNPSLNKSWVKENLKQNKEYEKANKLYSKDGEWFNVFKKANKRGISTSKLESKASTTDNSHEMKEYGFKPHVQNVLKTYDELKKGGYLPNVNISGFDTTMSRSGVYGAYRPKTGEYVINTNALSVPRIEKQMRINNLAGKSYQDVIIHELGHGVYYQNMVKSVTIKQGGVKQRMKFTAKQTAVRNAYAKLNNELRRALRTTNMEGLSGYVSTHATASKSKYKKDKATGQRVKLTKQQKAKFRKSAYVEGFAEGYVNYYRNRKFGEPLHPIGKAVGNFLKEINRYK